MSAEVSGPVPELAAPSVAVATRALFFGYALLMIGNGLQGSLVGIRSDAEGFGVAVSGLVMASYFAGFFAGSIFATRALKTVGHIRVFAAFASTASSAVLVHTLIVEPLVWIGMRFVFGLCMAGLYVVVESWLNELATNQTRGRLLSVYMFMGMGGYAIGQVLLNVADTAGFILFVVASVLVSMSLVPVALSGTTAPPLSLADPLSIKSLVAIVPTGVVGSLFVGAGTGILLGLGPVYAAGVGYRNSQIAVFLAAPMIGALVGQWPLGWLSDRVSRRPVILGTAIVGAAVGLTAARVGSYELETASMFVLGAMLFPLYSLTLAYTNDWLGAGQIMGASGTMVRVNGIGAVLGPLLAAFTMSQVSGATYFVTIGLSSAAIAVFVGYRVLVIEGLPAERQRRFANFPVRGAAAAGTLIPRRPASLPPRKQPKQRRRFRRSESEPSKDAAATAAAPEPLAPADAPPTD